MRVSLPPRVTPQVLGVDDFALHGDACGTLLVDATTTRLPLTLWEGRGAELLSHWLREHPGVEVACLDGSLAHRQGIAAGAPGAARVSDRFHRGQCLSRRVQDVACAHRGCLPGALPSVSESASPPLEEPDGNARADTSRAPRPKTVRGRAGLRPWTSHAKRPPSPREAARCTATPASTRAASPTSSCRSGSWQDASASFSATAPF
ncbi:transposase [Streptomyces erythrochromogenes]|uniref:transposase n=1 Tax=Streptomyces erythrochromogenes TaxID=285574 RepID=UPI00382C69ED|nr:transposase [Streptomyces erythrochromogenes]